jgi:glycosyltransferase involved in cell wall biosynthesis
LNRATRFVQEDVTGPGLLLGVGDFPDGGATSMRMRHIAQTIQGGGMAIQIALLHPVTKTEIHGNERVQGEAGGVPFRYLSGRTVRPASTIGALRDTVAGIVAFVRLVFRRHARPAFVIFYTPTFWKMIVPILGARLRGIPIFIEACEVWTSIPKEDLGSLTRRIVASWNRWLERWIPRLARGVIPISNRIASYYSELGVLRDHLFILPILVDVEQYRQRSDAEIASLRDTAYLLSSGSLAEKDGLSYIIEAFGVIANDFPELVLVFTGQVSESAKQSVLAAFRKLGRRERVIFTGFLSREQLVWAYQHARALLCCRSNSAFANFGFPTKLGEYLASGTPVIATRVGDVGLYLGDGRNAFLADAEDAGSIAGCMRKVIADADAAAEVGRAGQLVAERYFWFPVYSESLTAFLRNRSI